MRQIPAEYNLTKEGSHSNRSQGIHGLRMGGGGSSSASSSVPSVAGSAHPVKEASEECTLDQDARLGDSGRSQSMPASARSGVARCMDYDAMGGASSVVATRSARAVLVASSPLNSTSAPPPVPCDAPNGETDERLDSASGGHPRDHGPPEDTHQPSSLLLAASRSYHHMDEWTLGGCGSQGENAPPKSQRPAGPKCEGTRESVGVSFAVEESNESSGPPEAAEESTQEKADLPQLSEGDLMTLANQQLLVTGSFLHFHLLLFLSPEPPAG